MQRESPTDAIVTTHPSIITNVTVVPERCAEKRKQQIIHCIKELRKSIINNSIGYSNVLIGNYTKDN